MYVMCAICWDVLSKIPHDSMYGGRIGTICCGHVFHVGCINKFWNQQIRDYNKSLLERKENQPKPTLVYKCPVCRRGDEIPTVFEIFYQVIDMNGAPDVVTAAGLTDAKAGEKK